MSLNKTLLAREELLVTLTVEALVAHPSVVNQLAREEVAVKLQWFLLTEVVMNLTT